LNKQLARNKEEKRTKKKKRKDFLIGSLGKERSELEEIRKQH